MSHVCPWQRDSECRRRRRCRQHSRSSTHLHLFPATLSVAVESVATNGTHDKQVGCRAEAASRQVAAVLHGLVAAGGGHILRHDGRLEEFVTKPERGE